MLCYRMLWYRMLWYRMLWYYNNRPLSNPSKVVTSGSYEAGISDHNLIYVAINFLNRNPPSRIIEAKSYSDVNQNKLQLDLDAAPWDIIIISL